MEFLQHFLQVFFGRKGLGTFFNHDGDSNENVTSQEVRERWIFFFCLNWSANSTNPASGYFGEITQSAGICMMAK